MTTQTRIAAEEYLEALSAHGIEYLFANPGTDFAPIVGGVRPCQPQQPQGAAADRGAAREPPRSPWRMAIPW